MKLSGYTDVEDYNIRTLLWMMFHRDAWWCDFRWREWKLDGGYFWYDGPNWFARIGPLHIGLGFQ